MNRLNFTLPEFTRFSWVSAEARDVWEPRFRRVLQAWLRVEWLSVVAGIRPCATTFVSPEAFLAQAGDWARNGLNALPLEAQGADLQSGYCSHGVRVQWGKPYVFRMVLGTPSAVQSFLSAWESHDETEMASLLGRPPCCTEFFSRVWSDEGFSDTTWPMAWATEHGTFSPSSAMPMGKDLCAVPEQTADARQLEVAGPALCNILWRWMGIRAVPHLPCRFDCSNSAALGASMTHVGRTSGLGEEMDWLEEILSWPVEWSALHGIAEVRTPILKVVTQSDATAEKYVVRRPGTHYPNEGAKGVLFPYQTPDVPRLTKSRSYQKGLVNPIQVQQTYPDWFAPDNGFRSVFLMQRAQRPVAEVAAELLDLVPGPVLDLACHNGALLKAVQEMCPSIAPCGIDNSQEQIAHARLLHPASANAFFVGDPLTNEDAWLNGKHYRLALLMPGHLLGSSPERMSVLLSRLRTQCDQVIAYAYGDWLARFGSLEKLAEAIGLRVTDVSMSVTTAVGTVTLET